MKHADVVEVGLAVIGFLVSSTAVGSALGITSALFEEKSLSEIEYSGFVGTAAGLLFGIFIVCVIGVTGTL